MVKWSTPQEWLLDMIDGGHPNWDTDRSIDVLRAIVPRLDDSLIRDLLHADMADTGYYGELNSPQMWERTDDLQWVKRLSADHFHVVGVVQSLGKYEVTFANVDLTNWYPGDVAEALKPFGYTIDSLKEMYGASHKQVIAECIAESMDVYEWKESCPNEEGLAFLLNNAFGIEMNSAEKEQTE